MRKIISLTTSVIFFLFSPVIAKIEYLKNEKTENEFLNILNRTNYYDLTKKINDNKIRNILESKYFSNYLAKYYKTAVYTIFIYESGNFQHNQGIYDKDDMGYCQVNRRYWTLEMINNTFKLSKRITSWHQFKNDMQAQVEVCSLVWLYRIGVYLNNSKRKPPVNLVDYIALYHSFSSRSRAKYKKMVSDIFWKVYFSKAKI